MSESDPTCPFCGAAWTEHMLAQLDAASSPGCSCCEPPAYVQKLWGLKPSPPPGDIVCASCNRAIFYAPPAD